MYMLLGQEVYLLYLLFIRLKKKLLVLISFVLIWVLPVIMNILQMGEFWIGLVNVR